MIDIRQLKCGSHVLVDSQRVKVCGITRLKVGYHHSDDRPNANLRYARVNEAEPIAITPELTFMLRSIYGENMTIAKLMERWEAWAIVEGIGKDGIDKEQCVIVGVKLIEEKKRV